MTGDIEEVMVLLEVGFLIGLLGAESVGGRRWGRALDRAMWMGAALGAAAYALSGTCR